MTTEQFHATACGLKVRIEDAIRSLDGIGGVLGDLQDAYQQASEVLRTRETELQRITLALDGRGETVLRREIEVKRRESAVLAQEVEVAHRESAVKALQEAQKKQGECLAGVRAGLEQQNHEQEERKTQLVAFAAREMSRLSDMLAGLHNPKP